MNIELLNNVQIESVVLGGGSMVSYTKLAKGTILTTHSISSLDNDRSLVSIYLGENSFAITFHTKDIKIISQEERRRKFVEPSVAEPIVEQERQIDITPKT